MAADRPLNPSPVVHRFGPFRFNGTLRRLYKDDEPIALTPKAAETLLALLERADRVVEKDELLRVVWGDVFVGEDTLAQNISTLRRALGDDAGRPRFIATMPRRGYRFVAPVTTLQTAKTDPTEISISPVKMTSVIPIAIIITGRFCRNRSTRLAWLK